MKQSGTQTILLQLPGPTLERCAADRDAWNELRRDLARAVWRYGDLYGSAIGMKTEWVRNDIKVSELMRRAEVNACIEAWALVVRSIESLREEHRSELYSFYSLRESPEEGIWGSESPAHRANPSAWSAAQCHYASQLLYSVPSIIALNNHRVRKPEHPAETDRRRQLQVETWLQKKLKKLRWQFHPAASRSMVYDANQYACTPQGLRLTLSIGGYAILPIQHRYKGNLRLVWETEERVSLHVGYGRTVSDPREEGEVASRAEVYGTDWNLQAHKMLVGEDGERFGNVDPIVKAKIQLQKVVQAKNHLRTIALRHPEKAKRIRDNNLGSRHFERRQARLNSWERVTVQTALHRLGRHMQAQGKTLNAHEQLHFVGKSRSKSESQRIHMTAYGQMNDYRQHILPLYSVQPAAVNPAYTSRWVPSEADPRLGTLGQRQGDLVRAGPDTHDSATLAGRNIGDRYLDRAITLSMTPEEVKVHLNQRTVRKHAEIGDDALVASSDSVRSTSPTGVAAAGGVTTLPNGPLAGSVDKDAKKHA